VKKSDRAALLGKHSKGQVTMGGEGPGKKGSRDEAQRFKGLAVLSCPGRGRRSMTS